jgi:hypothetical protein
MRTFLVLLLTLALVPSVLAVEERTARYVAGTAHPALADHGVNGPCTGIESPENDLPPHEVGGTCFLPVTAGETLHVAVEDDVLGDVAYSVTFLVREPVAAGGFNAVPCAPRVDASGTVTLVVPAGCTDVAVRPHAGATTGVIRMW